jgi:hypothetical protein
VMFPGVDRDVDGVAAREHHPEVGVAVDDVVADSEQVRSHGAGILVTVVGDQY